MKILQVPALELRSAILEELQTNPLLEEFGTNDDSLDADTNELSPDEIENEEIEEFPEEEKEVPDSTEETEEETDLEQNDGEDLNDMDFSDEFSILNEMEEDLREHFESEYEGEAKLGNSEADEKENSFRFLGYRNFSSGTSS